MSGHLNLRRVMSCTWPVTLAASIAACTVNEKPASPSPTAAVPEIAPGILAGYLPRAALPDSALLVSPPPEPGSAAFARDEEASRAGLALRGTPRWTAAASDAELKFPAAAGAFACAADLAISPDATPHLYMLLRRTLTDAGLSTYGAKTKYQRQRPFMTNGQPTCTPHEEAMLRKDGSYPSGHSAIGWALALVLAEAAPDRANAILARGLDFGQSRVVCNVHWQSDVDAGRIVGAGAVSRLHADAGFSAELAAAKAEVAAARSSGTHAADCS
jgi:acid phosphatase (class A)